MTTLEKIVKPACIIILGMLLCIPNTLQVAGKERDADMSSTKVYTDSITGMEFVWVPRGCYQMGDTFGEGNKDEYPVHEACVDGFYMGKYEVTQSQWSAVMASNPSRFLGKNRPVEMVSWNEVQEFIFKLNEKSGKNYRLPTEAEWEYAARSGGKNEKWSGTSNQTDLGNYIWYNQNSGGTTHPVGQKHPNGFGLYDMSGNVWEWCQDWYGNKTYNENTSKDKRRNPQGPANGFCRVARGGVASFTCNGGPWQARTSYRYCMTPGSRDIFGFRLIIPQ